MLRKMRILLCALLCIVFLNPSTLNAAKLTGGGDEYNCDLGLGIGLDYGGIAGVQLDYVFPFRRMSIFGAAGLQFAGLGWNVGTRLYFVKKVKENRIRPNVKIMYGVNRATIVIGKSEYNKLFTGITPGIGCEFIIDKSRRNGIAMDLNFPIGSQDFNDQLDRINNDPEVSDITMLPVAYSIGYRHSF